MSLENEPWSNGSSPLQQPPPQNSSSLYQPPRDASTPQRHIKLQQHKEKTSTGPVASSQSSETQPVQKEKDPGLSQDFWLTRGTRTIRRGSKGKVARRSSDSGGAGKVNSDINGITLKNESIRASAYSPITVLYVQGKSSSMSGCLNCFSTPLAKEGRLNEFRSPKNLPRSSSVISTAEGSSRRSSVSSDCRVAIKAEPVESGAQEETPSQSREGDSASKNGEPELVPPAKPPRDPAAVLTKHHKTPVQESLLGSSFTFTSVFSNTIFSDSEVSTTTGQDLLEIGQEVVCPNPSPVQSALIEGQETAEKTPLTLLTSENEQSQNEEHSAGFEGKSQLLTIT